MNGDWKQKGGLVDLHGRVHDYLRVSVTDRCNLRCRYCMPPEGVEWLSHESILRNEEIVRVIGVFCGLGIAKVRFTGGEPLVRRGFMELVTGVRRLLPDTELCLTTNGILLKGYLEALRDLGVRKLNVSLDTVSPERYRELTGSDCHREVVEAIDRALELDAFEIKLNAVLFRETLEELEAFLDYFSGRRVTLRFIEVMPSGLVKGLEFLPAAELERTLAAMGALVRNGSGDTRVARMYDFRYRGRYDMKIGVIPPLTGCFCDRCNRVRLSSVGALRTCLHGAEFCDLRGLLRSGAGDDELAAAITTCIREKPREHALQCHDMDGTCSSLSSMSRIGG
ncbi:MAG: GTP 3',8-cyclase MoaA [Spirochaetes bacterium]|nr:GTP 3',8-cyclase MoaA [Spirochaetota bacterium]